jgi:multidrug resistance efflux pump
MANLELTNSRGQYQHPSREAIEAAGLTGVALELWESVERANADVIAAEATLKRAHETVEAQQEALTRAQARLNQLRPPVDAVDAARAFILSGRAG